MDSPEDFPFTGSIPIPSEELTEAFRLGGLLLEVKDDGKTREWDLYTQAGQPVNNVVLAADEEAADVDLAGQNIAKGKAVELHSRGASMTREIDSDELDELAGELNQQLKSKMPAVVRLADEIRSHYWRLTQPSGSPRVTSKEPWITFNERRPRRLERCLLPNCFFRDRFICLRS